MEEQPYSLGCFTDKGQWETFYAIRGEDDSFEWIADWAAFQKLLLEFLQRKHSDWDKGTLDGVREKKSPPELKILVPGCGTSKLSEHLYGNGLKYVTNVDFCEVAINNMSEKYGEEKPELQWLVMDMINLQFRSKTFDVVVDKGGLDSLMDANFGPRSGNRYLTKVKEVLTDVGKFICLTNGDPHVMDILFNKFRIGWKMIIHSLQAGVTKQMFMVVLEKEDPTSILAISENCFFIMFLGTETIDFSKALDKEKEIRKNDVLYTLEDLRLGAKGDISVVVPGRRIRLILGEPGVSSFSYYGVLLDAKSDSEENNTEYVVVIVPELRNYDKIFTSEERQWLMSDTAKSARLLLVLLDSSNSISSSDDIKNDLAPLAQQLAPKHHDLATEIEILPASEGIKQQEKVHEAISELFGPIVVEDVGYEDGEKYRRLIFQRAENMVQSEVRLSTKASIETEEEAKAEQSVDAENKAKKRPKRRKEKKQEASAETEKEAKQDESVKILKAEQDALVETEKQTEQEALVETEKETEQEASLLDEMEVAENFLASPYHNEILMGIICYYLPLLSLIPRESAKAVILGLGAGVLPMYLKKNLPPPLEILVFELDPMIVDVARQNFGFREDDSLKVHISDGVEAIKNPAVLEQVVGKRCKHDPCCGCYLNRQKFWYDLSWRGLC